MIQDDVQVMTADGVAVQVPASLAEITTYVLLEQEAWFEKELGFVRSFLRPGMAALDAGASYGVYALPMLACVGESGRVVAVEPNPKVAARLARSASAWPAGIFALAQAALSDAPGRLGLAVGGPSEAGRLAQVAAPGTVEVAVTTIDALVAERFDRRIDLLKIDVEGHELEVMQGAARVMRDSAPVVVFEMQSAAVVDDRLMKQFWAQGMTLARWLPGGPLVAVGPSEKLDPYEINLVAFGESARRELQQIGLLGTEVDAGAVPSAAQRHEAARALPFSVAVAQGFMREDRLDRRYREALGLFAAWRDVGLPLDQRIAALQGAAARLKAVCAAAPKAAHLSTLGRVASEAGEREVAVQAMERLLISAGQGGVALDAPFWPPLSRFDDLSPGKDVANALIVAAIEAHARWKGFSSYFSFPLEEYFWACSLPYATPAMLRRACLARLRVGRAVPDRDLALAATGSLNAALWLDGTIMRMPTR